MCRWDFITGSSPNPTFRLGMNLIRLAIPGVFLAGLPASLAICARTGILFVEVQEAAELTFRYRNSPTPYNYLIEMMGGSVAILDYDYDGWQDVFFVNGARLGPPQPNRILGVEEEFIECPENAQKPTRCAHCALRPGAASNTRSGFRIDTAFQAQPPAMRLYHEGVALMERGKLNEAVERLHAATTLKPDFVDAHFALGVALQQQGRARAPDAVDAFLRVLELNPDHAGAHASLGLVLAESGDSEAAAVQLQKAIMLDPLNAELRIFLGKQLFLSQKYSDALESFYAALQLKPDHSGAHLGRGITLLKLRRPADAAAAFQSVLRLNPQDADAHLQLGRMALASGDLSIAENELKQAIRLRPELAEPHEELAKVYRRQDMDGEAARELREALRLAPHLFDAVYALATLLRAQGRIAEARLLFDRVQELQKEREAVRRAHELNADGIKLMDDGNIEAALAAFRKARVVDPTFFMAAYNEGVVLARQDQKVAAVEALRAAIRLRPDFVMAHYALGIVLKTLGDPEGDLEIAKAHALNKYVAQPLGRNAVSFVNPQRGNK